MAVTIAWTNVADLSPNSTYQGFIGVVNIGAGRFLAVTSRGHVYRSGDEGLTWGSVGTVTGTVAAGGSNLITSEMVFAPTGSTDVAYVAGQFSSTSPGVRIYRTTDGGATWTVVFEHEGGSITNHHNVCAFVDLGGDTYLGFGLSGVEGEAESFDLTANTFRSTDGGDTWALFSDIDSDDAGIKYTAACRLASGRIVTARLFNNQSDDAIWYSDDDGATWTASGALPGIDNSTSIFSRLILGIAELAPDVVIVSGSMIKEDVSNNRTLSIWRSTDGAETFSRIANADILDHPTANNNVSAGGFARVNDLVAVVGYGYQDQPHASEPGFRATEDGGLTWNVVNTADNPPDGTFYTPSQLALNDDGDVVIAAAGTPAGSNGGTEIWRGVISGLEPPVPSAAGGIPGVCGHPILVNACVQTEVA